LEGIFFLVFLVLLVPLVPLSQRFGDYWIGVLGGFRPADRQLLTDLACASRLSRTCGDKQNLLFRQQGTGKREQKIRLRVNGNKEYILPHYADRAGVLCPGITSWVFLEKIFYNFFALLLNHTLIQQRHQVLLKYWQVPNPWIWTGMLWWWSRVCTASQWERWGWRLVDYLCLQ
jgi:hypothetical protein